MTDFLYGWDKDEFLAKLGLSTDDYVARSDIESALYRDIISSDLESSDTDSEGTLKDRSLQDRLAKIDAYATKNPGLPVSHLILETFPELLDLQTLETPIFPTEAPIKWSAETRQLSEGELESAPSFIQRVYGEWLGKGMTRADVRRLDPALMQSFYQWIRDGKELPSDFDFPTKAKQNDRTLDELRKHGTDGEAVIPVSHAEREARRLRQIRYRREGRQSD